MPVTLADGLARAEVIRFQAATWSGVPSMQPAQGVIDDLITEIGSIVTDVTAMRDEAEGLYRADLDAALTFCTQAQTAIEAL